MNHGQHEDGRPITDTDIEAMPDEAERGYDVDTLPRRRRGGRPPLGSAGVRHPSPQTPLTPCQERAQYAADCI